MTSKGKRQAWRDTFGEQRGAPKNVVVDGLELRFCTRCQVYKPIDLFVMNEASYGPGGRFRHCKQCTEVTRDLRLAEKRKTAPRCPFCEKPRSLSRSETFAETCGSRACRTARNQQRPFRPLSEQRAFRPLPEKEDA